MTAIYTFLGKGGTGRTTAAIAAAQKLADQGNRVLLALQDPSPALETLLGASPETDAPTEIAANCHAVRLDATTLLERSWEEEVKPTEAQYLRTPILERVYGQELGILPGMDSALALNALREYNASGRYDIILYDGPGELATLRMLGLPETLSWYVRRTRQVFFESDLGQAVSPFIQPVTSTVLNVSWSADELTQQTSGRTQNLLEAGKAAIADPQRVAAYLVTSERPEAVATAQYLWGSAQQVGVSVGGVLLNQGRASEALTERFHPLPVSELPACSEGDWQPLIAAMPDLGQAAQAPKPVTVDMANRQVHLFLPGFDKNQVKLTQYGPEITIEAGDQRRNLELPPELRGQPARGAKFNGRYLTVSF